MIRLECWTTPDGRTVCMYCACDYTGSRPVALEAPRKCSKCGKQIKDLWPQGASSPDTGRQEDRHAAQ